MIVYYCDYVAVINVLSNKLFLIKMNCIQVPHACEAKACPFDDSHRTNNFVNSATPLLV